MLSHDAGLLLLVAILLATGFRTPLVHAGCPENTEYCQCVTDHENCVDPGTAVMWRCRGLPGVHETLHLLGNVTKSVTCLEIVDSQVPLLDRETMALFPKLKMLLIQNSGLQAVKEDTFNSNSLIRRLYLMNNHLTEFPPLHNLLELQILDLTRNEIVTIPDGALSNNHQILEIEMEHNRLRALRGDLFANKCYLGSVDFSHNPELEVVEDSVFNGTNLRQLDLAFTRINRVPVTDSLRKHLNVLRLDNTFQLTSFSAFASDPAYFNQTFPRLTKVHFAYHAHCCQMNGRHYFYGPGEPQKRFILSLLERISSPIFGKRQVSDSPAATTAVTIEPSRTQHITTVQPSPASTPDCLSQPLITTTATIDTCSTTPGPISTPGPDEFCHEDYCMFHSGLQSEGLCNHCKETQCGDSDTCEYYENNNNFTSLCLCNSRKRSAHSQVKRNVDCTSDVVCANCSSLSTLPAGWFRLDNNSDLVCRNASSPTTAPTTSTTSEPIDNLRCQPDDISQFTRHGLTNCFPMPDAFNPCTNLLNDKHYLRVAIWCVIGLSLFGNGLVIIVFFIYVVLIRRTMMEYFVMHFFYFNLALADFLMCVYLLTIAGQDLATLNNFALYDVEWRIGNGCKFAGFTAILSTVVSVYVLTVITLERGYTIINAMHRRKITKKVAFVVMGIGWMLGLTIAILPVTGKVNDYGSVAICLPFRVDSDLDKSYVVFLLLATGLAFLAIAITYVVIFSHIFCKKSLSHSSSNKRKNEIKVAIRMFGLVFTNFLAWFPIAIVSLASVFGEGIVHDLEFAKWAIVFIFPINSCVNPILYSLSTKLFRENVIIVLSKMNICRDRAQKIARRRAGITPSVSSNQTSEGGLRGQRPALIDRLRLLSISSQGRRGSILSEQSDQEHSVYRIALDRRNSVRSDSSNEDSPMTKTGLRRVTSGNSSDSSTLPATVLALENLKPGARTSVGSLGTLPEEAAESAPCFNQDDFHHITNHDMNSDSNLAIPNGNAEQCVQHPTRLPDTANMKYTHNHVSDSQTTTN